MSMAETEAPEQDAMVEQMENDDAPLDTEHTIGGSDVGAILGHVRWRSPLDVYLEKLGIKDRDADSEAAYWGRKLEPEVLRRYAEKEGAYVLARTTEGDDDTYQVLTPAGTSWRVRRGGDHSFGTAIEILAGLRHPRHTWATGHPDGLVVDPDDGSVLRGVEGKTTSAWRQDEWGPDASDQVPKSYVLQVQWYAWLCRREHGLEVEFDMPTLIGGQQFRTYPIPYSPPLAWEAYDAARAMVERLAAGDPPEARAGDDEALVALWPEDTGEEVVVPSGAEPERWARLYRAGQLKEKEGGRLKDEAKAKIHQAMGDATKLNGDGWSWTWKKPEPREQVDYEEAFFELAMRYDAPEQEVDEIEAECTETIERGRRPYPYVRNLEPLEADHE